MTDARASNVTGEVLGTVTPAAVVGDESLEVLATADGVHAMPSDIWVEVMGTPSPVASDISSLVVEVLGVRGAEDLGLRDVARTGYLYIKHTDGDWYQITALL